MHSDQNRSCVDCGRKSEEEKYPEFCFTKNAGEKQIEFVKVILLCRQTF